MPALPRSLTPELAPDYFVIAARRLMARCEELARVTAVPGGIERVYLSPEHARVNRLVAEWMREVGMTTRQDAAGNQVGRLDPSTPGRSPREEGRSPRGERSDETERPDASRLAGLAGGRSPASGRS